MEDNFVSTATMTNWQRLNVSESEVKFRLSKRANKRFSTKKIIPVEYFVNKKNVVFVETILDYVNVNNLSIRAVIYNIALNLLNRINKIDINNSNNIFTNNTFLSEILNDFSQSVDDYLISIPIPLEEFDFLGVLYQSLLNEGVKNCKGSYYTPTYLLQDFMQNLNVDTKFLDPCCGTGSFLLAAADKIDNPNYIYGVDSDEIACFIAKINLIIKYRDFEFKPNIYNTDFLLNCGDLENARFDVIATNPPWGAKTDGVYNEFYPEILSGESYSYFIVKSERLLKPNGCCFFLLPESILNVSVHKDVRKFILKKFHITSIKHSGRLFAGVLTNSVFLILNKEKLSDSIKIVSKNKTMFLHQDIYQNFDNYNFALISNDDAAIINRLYSVKYTTLNNSLWALGIVTGNNKKHILSSCESGAEKIYTGKNISKYFLTQADKFIKYDRENFQQAAADNLYRTEEKLVYKFISKKLVFAYDNSSSLVLNSANVLIPQVKTHSIKTVLAFLNSEIFEYLYCKQFSDLKVLKSNLQQLPFPVLSVEQRESLESLVNSYLEDRNVLHLKEIDDMIYKIFKCTNQEIMYIKNAIS